MRQYSPGLLTLGCIGLLALWAWRGLIVNASTPGAVCDVHHVPLQEGVVSIQYGLPLLAREEVDAWGKLFPNARSSFHGGCTVKVAPWARVSFCPECRKAEAAWRAIWKQKMAPLKGHWERLSRLVGDNAKFAGVHPYIDMDDGPRVGLEGQVESDEILTELRRMVKDTSPPQPVYWNVRVSH